MFFVSSLLSFSFFFSLCFFVSLFLCFFVSLFLSFSFIFALFLSLTDHGMSVLGVIDLTKATEVRPTVLKEAPTETKHGFEIVTPTRVWKICPDVEDPAEAEFAVERWVSLLAASEAYAKVQLRGMNYTRTSNDGGTGDGTDGGTENTKWGTGETKGTRGTREVNGEQNAPNTRLTLHQVKVEGSPGSPALDSPSGRRALLVRSVRRIGILTTVYYTDV
jgi:hypothetical protein